MEPSQIDFSLAKQGAWYCLVDELVNAKQATGDIVASCWQPDHEDRKPSAVYYENGSCYCFGCGRGSDVYDFLAHTRSMGIVEAAKWLAGGRVGGNLGSESVEASESDSQPKPDKVDMSDLFACSVPADGTPIENHLRCRNIWYGNEPLPIALRWMPASAPLRYATKYNNLIPFHSDGAEGVALWVMADQPCETLVSDMWTSCQVQSVYANNCSGNRWSPFSLGVSYWTALFHSEGESVWMSESPTDAVALMDGFFGGHMDDIEPPRLIVSSMGASRLPVMTEQLVELRLPFRLFPDMDEPGLKVCFKIQKIIARNNLPCHIDLRHQEHKDIGEYHANRKKE